MQGLVYKLVLYLLLKKKKGLLMPRGGASEHVFILPLHRALQASSRLLAVFCREVNHIVYLLS